MGSVTYYGCHHMLLRKIFIFLFSAIFIFLYFDTCNAQMGDDSSAPEQYQAIRAPSVKIKKEMYPGKRILFISAEKVFSDNSAKGSSDLGSLLISLGFEITETYMDHIAGSDLQNYDIVVFSNNWWGQREISDGEAQALSDFVDQGNSLLLEGEHGLALSGRQQNLSVNKVGKEFGIQLNNDMLCDPTDHFYYSSDPDGGVDSPIICDFSEHFVTSNVNSSFINWGCSLTINTSASGIAFSDSDSWRDLDGSWDGD